MHYTGTGKMHSFKGLLADDGQNKLRIQGATGEIAWRITKFQTLPHNPGEQDQESVTKIYRETQSSIDGLIDFTQDELLAASIVTNQGSLDVYGISRAVIFDNALFVRNIYVSTHDVKTGQSVSYYIELEEVKVSTAGMAQLSVAAARRGYIPGT